MKLYKITVITLLSLLTMACSGNYDSEESTEYISESVFSYGNSGCTGDEYVNITSIIDAISITLDIDGAFTLNSSISDEASVNGTYIQSGTIITLSVPDDEAEMSMTILGDTFIWKQPNGGECVKYTFVAL